MFDSNIYFGININCYDNFFSDSFLTVFSSSEQKCKFAVWNSYC